MITPNKAQIFSSQRIRKALFRLKGLFTTLGHFCFGLLILISLFVSARQVSLFYDLSIPPAILGIAVLFITLISLRCVPKSFVTAGKPLLAYMSLFFLPAIVAIVNYVDLIKMFPVALFLAIVVTTLISLVATALLAQWLMHSLNPEAIENNPAADNDIQTMNQQND